MSERKVIYLISGSRPLRSAMLRAAHASGCSLTSLETLADLPEGAPAGSFVVLEAAAVSESDAAAHIDRLAEGYSVLLLNAGFEDRALELLRGRVCNHAIQIEQLDLDQFIVTMNKLLTGDIFGISKYLPWGVVIQEARIDSYGGKRDAIAAVGDYARGMGCKRQLATRIEDTVDELLMNALYDAPSETGNKTPFLNALTAGQLAEDPVLLSYACGGRVFVVSVTDVHGRLSKGTLVERLGHRGEKLSARGGIGLYLLLNNATRLIINVAPGACTEVICFFEMALTHGAEGVGSFHYFEGSPPG